MDEIDLQLVTVELSQQKEQPMQGHYHHSKQNKAKTKKDLTSFLDHLKQNMHKKRYRIVIGEIEHSEPNYEHLSKHYQVNILKARSLVKVIARKIAKYPIELKDKASHQRSSVEFWFNQLYLTLQALMEPIKTEKNDLRTEEHIDIVESVVVIIADTLYQIALMSWQGQEILETCAYIGIASRLIIYSDYMRNPKTLHAFQKVLLFRASILLSDRDYANALVVIDKCREICFKAFFLLMHYDEPFVSQSIRKKKSARMIYMNIINLVLIHYQRGAFFEKTGKLLKAIEAYKQCQFLCMNYLQYAQPELTLLVNRIAERAMQSFCLIEAITQSVNDLKAKALQKAHQSIADRKSNEHNVHAIKQYSCKDNLFVSPLFANTLKQIDRINAKEDMSFLSFKAKYPKAKYITSTVRLIDNLLSPDCQPIVTKMKKMEISTFDKDTLSKISKQAMQRQSSAHTVLRSSAPRLDPSFKHNPDAVEKLPFDKDNFAKSYLKKKQFLEEYSHKELCFHKKMLALKKCEKSLSRGRFNPVTADKEIEDFFFVKSTLAKTKQTKSVFQNLMSRNQEPSKVLLLSNRSRSCSKIMNNPPMQKATSAVRSSIFDFVPLQVGNKEYDKQTSNDINFVMLRKITCDYEQIEKYRRHLEEKNKERRKLNKSSDI